MDLDKYIVKVLSHEEMNIIKKFTLTKSYEYQRNYVEMNDFSPDKYLNMECKSIVLCYPQSIEQNIDSIRNGNNAIIFISEYPGYIYCNPQLWFWAYYSSPNIKEILLNKYCISYFDSKNIFYISGYHGNRHNMSKKIITHFQNIFILTKEIIDIEDVVKYIFTLMFMNLFNEKN
jgi:hypothetical protein